MSDLWGALDPQKVAALLTLAVAAAVLLLAAVTAFLLLARSRARTQPSDPDPFLEPGSHQGLKLGPLSSRVPITRARHMRELGGETSRPGTP